MELSEHQMVGLVTFLILLAVGIFGMVVVMCQPVDEETEEQATERAGFLDRAINQINEVRL